MIDYDLTQAKVYKKLIESKVIDWTQQNFSKKALRGEISSNNKNGRARRFNYEEVLTDIKNMMPNNTEEGKEGSIDNKEKSNKPLNLNDARLNLIYEQTRLAKIKANMEEGKLISREQVSNEAFSLVREIRDQFLTLPEKLSSEMANITNPHTIKEMMYEEINIILQNLSNGVKKYE